MTDRPNYYEVLCLPPALQHASHIPTQTLRNAYRRALLQNHPDKDKGANTARLFTIDQISAAFITLSDAKLHKQYNEDLKKGVTADAVAEPGRFAFRAGIEVADLDDLSVSDEERTWFRSCRCGNSRGFLIREADLEEASNEGEINVECVGCSLWLKVLFDVVDDGAHNIETRHQA